MKLLSAGEQLQLQNGSRSLDDDAKSRVIDWALDVVVERELLQSVLDGYLEICGLDVDGPIFTMTPKGCRKAQEVKEEQYSHDRDFHRH